MRCVGRREAIVKISKVVIILPSSLDITKIVSRTLGVVRAAMLVVLSLVCSPLASPYVVIAPLGSCVDRGLIRPSAFRCC